jgi:hypothetical protein
MVSRRTVLLSSLFAGLVLAASAEASCVPMTAAQQRARADIIFDGVALDGPTSSGIERFRVIRYRKGTGPRIVRLRTGRRLFPDGSGTTTSVSIDAAQGERWRIFARRLRRGVYETNVCDGSRRLRR